MNQRIIDVAALSGSQRTTVIEGQGYFPVIAAAPSGNLLVVLRGGAPHMGLGGRLDAVRSTDGGRTWTSPVTIADSERDDRNPAPSASTRTATPFSPTTGRAATTKTVSGRQRGGPPTRGSSDPRPKARAGPKIASSTGSLSTARRHSARSVGTQRTRSTCRCIRASRHRGPRALYPSPRPPALSISSGPTTEEKRGPIPSWWRWDSTRPIS